MTESDAQLAKELHLAMGKQTLRQLIESLEDVEKLHPMGEILSIGLAVTCLEIFLANHTDIGEEDLEKLIGFFGAGLLNATTDIHVPAVYECISKLDTID